MPLTKFDEYIQKLLLAQYEVSEIIEHKLTRGEIREDFLKEQILKRNRKYRATNGIIADAEGNQSCQCDCLLVSNQAQTRGIGKQEIVDINDVLFVIEVKSNITGTDLKKFNKDIEKIKKMKHQNQFMRFIMFGYKISLKHKTVLKRFKHYVDKQSGVIIYDETGQETYPNIDILISLDENEDLSEVSEVNKQFVIQRFEAQKGFFKYVYNSAHPIIRQFFGIIR